MKTLLLACCLVLSWCLIGARGQKLSSDEADLSEAKTGNFFTNNGQSFVVLNTTQLLFWAAVLGLGLLGALLLSSAYDDDHGAGYGYHGSGSGYGGSGHGGGGGYGHGYRSKRFAQHDSGTLRDLVTGWS